MDLYTSIKNYGPQKFANINLWFVKQVVILYDYVDLPVKLR